MIIDTQKMTLVYCSSRVEIYEVWKDENKVTLWVYSDGSPRIMLITNGNKPLIEVELPLVLMP